MKNIYINFSPCGEPDSPILLRYQGFAVANYSFIPDALKMNESNS